MTVWILAALLLRGCLIGAHPFYEARDLASDDRIVGVYNEPQTGVVATVVRTTSRGRYRAILQENGTRSLYALIVFRVGRRTFVDISAENTPAARNPNGDASPVTDVLATATSGGRHMVARVEFSRGMVGVQLPSADSLAALWETEPRLRRTVQNETVSIVTEPTSTLRRILERRGQNDALFEQEYWIAKTSK